MRNIMKSVKLPGLNHMDSANLLTDILMVIAQFVVGVLVVKIRLMM